MTEKKSSPQGLMENLDTESYIVGNSFLQLITNYHETFYYNCKHECHRIYKRRLDILSLIRSYSQQLWLGYSLSQN